MKAMEATHKAHTESMFSNKIKEALKRKIRAQQQIFHSGDKVYYKRDQVKGPSGHIYKGPAVVLGRRGQVYWIVHQNKVLSCAASRLISVEDAEGTPVDETGDSGVIGQEGGSSSRVEEEEVSSRTQVEGDSQTSKDVAEIIVPSVGGGGDAENESATERGGDQESSDEVENDGGTHANIDQGQRQVVRPDNYPKRGDRIQYLENGQWETRDILSRWKKSSDYFNVRPVDDSQSQTNDHGIHLDTAVWQYADGDNNEDQDVEDIAFTIYDELVTVIPASEHDTEEVKTS